MTVARSAASPNNANLARTFILPRHTLNGCATNSVTKESVSFDIQSTSVPSELSIAPINYHVSASKLGASIHASEDTQSPTQLLFFGND